MDEKLVAFLYVLMRDEVPCGKVEGILQKHVMVAALARPGDPVEYSNKHLEAYAREIAGKLSGS